MAKHANDPGTIDAFPVKRGRGRPKTGNAMTGAERVRLCRERKRAAGLFTRANDESQWQVERRELRARIARLEVEVAAVVGERTFAFEAAEKAYEELAEWRARGA